MIDAANEEILKRQQEQQEAVAKAQVIRKNMDIAVEQRVHEFKGKFDSNLNIAARQDYRRDTSFTPSNANTQDVRFKHEGQIPVTLDLTGLGKFLKSFEMAVSSAVDKSSISVVENRVAQNASGLLGGFK